MIQNGGTGTLIWSVDAAEFWLQVDPQEGRSSDQASIVTVSVDRSRIEENGTYTSEVVVTSDGGTAIIPVTVQVEGKASASVLRVSPVSLAFGETSTRKTIGITNGGSGELTWQGSSAQEWISISPDSGFVSSGGAPVQVTVEVDRSQLSPGEHLGSLDVISSGGSISVPITVSVPTPVISVSTRAIDFRSDLNIITLEIANTGTGDLAWEFGYDLDWLQVEPSVGTTGQVAMSVQLLVQRQGLEKGAYDGLVLLSSNSTSESVIELRVKMQVTEQPELAVQPDSLDFGSEGNELSLQISNANNGTLSWQAEVDESWLILGESSGDVSLLGATAITVTVGRQGLTAGVYQGKISVSSNGGSRTVPVSMEVGQYPRLIVDKVSLDFSSALVTQTLELRNTGTGRLTWSVQEEVAWCEASPTDGTTLEETDQLTFTVNRAGLEPGTYTSIVTIASDGGEQEVAVEMQVLENNIPVADAGVDQEGVEGETVQLDGSGSRDADGDVLTYRWIAPVGVELSDATAAQPFFTPVSAGVYQIDLVVNDGQADSAPDEVVVTVMANTADAEIIGEIVDDGTEENTADAEIIGEIVEGSESEIIVELPGGETLEMVWIDPGTFTMGSPSSEVGRDDDEGPQHEVTISQGFYLGKYEVTQGQWESVMGTTPWGGLDYVRSNLNHPAAHISWEDMEGFVGRLNDAAGEAIYRLPSEAEWEYACRAGTTTRWSFGDDESQLGDYAWYRENALNVRLEYAQPVGTKLPNPWRLYDMHGNVWEWCQDWSGVYSSGSQVDPMGPATGSYRVVRGGGFNRIARLVRSADRSNGSPTIRFGYVGFRLLRTR